MLNRFKKLIRHYWHDGYYFFVSDKGVDFAMTCREATEKIDLQDLSKSITEKTRVRLHVSLCQACNNYFKFSSSLRSAVKKIVSSKQHTKTELDKLNDDLLQKFRNNFNDDL